MLQDSAAGRVNKRLRTRDRLLVAAQELLLEKHASEISIRDITGRAGVVHATFYNYYKTTGAAFEAVNLLVLGTYSRVLERTLANINDPAERIAASSRKTMRIVSRSRSLGKLLFDSGLNTTPVVEGIRARISADMRLGLDAGRFKVSNLDLTVSAATGMGLGVAIDVYEGRLSGKKAEGVATLILRFLGIPDEEAQAIAARPLPRYKMPALPLSLVEQTVAS